MCQPPTKSKADKRPTRARQVQAFWGHLDSLGADQTTGQCHALRIPEQHSQLRSKLETITTIDAHPEPEKWPGSWDVHPNSLCAQLRCIDKWAKQTSELCRFRKGGQFWKKKIMACRRRPCLARPRLPQQMQKNRQKKYTPTPITRGYSQVQTLSVDAPTFRCIGPWWHTSCDGVRQRES